MPDPQKISSQVKANIRPLEIIRRTPGRAKEASLYHCPLAAPSPRCFSLALKWGFYPNNTSAFLKTGSKDCDSPPNWRTERPGARKAYPNPPLELGCTVPSGGPDCPQKASHRIRSLNPDSPRHCSPQILPSLHTQSAKAQGEPWSCLVVVGTSFPTLEKKKRPRADQSGGMETPLAYPATRAIPSRGLSWGLGKKTRWPGTPAADHMGRI